MSVSNDFQSQFCSHRNIPPEHYAREVMARAMYPHARVFVWLLGWLGRNYQQADYDFIYDVGRITRFSEYETAAKSYFEHPMNQNNVLRRRLLMRISTVRMRRLVRDVMRPARGAPALATAEGAGGRQAGLRARSSR